MPAQTANAVANYFIRKSIDTGVEMTPMKLLKLVYIAHGFHLAATAGAPLIGEAVQAWKYGPVIPDLYHRLKEFGNGQITTLIADYAEQGDGTFKRYFDTVHPYLNPFLDQVWDAFKNYTGGQLSTLTHQKGTAWDEMWNNRGGCSERGKLIPNDLIAEKFRTVGS